MNFLIISILLVIHFASFVLCQSPSNIEVTVRDRFFTVFDTFIATVNDTNINNNITIQTIQNDKTFESTLNYTLLKEVEDLMLLYQDDLQTFGRKNKFFVKKLNIFVENYMNYHLKQIKSDTINMRLQYCKCALAAERDTIRMVTTSSTEELIKFAKNELQRYNILEPFHRLYSRHIDTEQKYIADTFILLVRTTGFMLICIAVQSLLCITALGTLMSIQLVIYILVLIRYLDEASML